METKLLLQTLHLIQRKWAYAFSGWSDICVSGENNLAIDSGTKHDEHSSTNKLGRWFTNVMSGPNIRIYSACIFLTNVFRGMLTGTWTTGWEKQQYTPRFLLDHRINQFFSLVELSSLFHLPSFAVQVVHALWTLVPPLSFRFFSCYDHHSRNSSA